MSISPGEPFEFNQSALVNYNFTSKYRGWFSIIQCKSNIQVLLNKLFTLKSDKNFKNLNSELNYLYNSSTIFLTPNDCEYAVDTFNKLCLIKRLIDNYRASSLKKEISNITNDTDLLLNEFGEKDKNTICLNINNVRYKFRIHELLSIYKFSSFNMNYSCPEPINAKNPYTNEHISMKDHFIIYEKLFKYYCSNNKSLPEHYILLKNSYFDINLFNKKYYCYMLYKSAVGEVINISTNEWFMNMDDYLSSSTHYCKKCFQKDRSIRKQFEGILELFVLNDQNVYTYGDAIRNYSKIAKKNNLFFKANHYISHRKFKRVRRIRSRQPSSIPENVIESYIELPINTDNPIDINEDSTSAINHNNSNDITVNSLEEEL